MTYVVNGEEFSTKKDATAALFEAAERGEQAILEKIEASREADTSESDNDQAPAGVDGPPVIL